MVFDGKAAFFVCAEAFASVSECFQTAAYDFEYAGGNDRGFVPKVGREIEDGSVFRDGGQSIAEREPYGCFRRHGLVGLPNFVRNETFRDLLPKVAVEAADCLGRIRPHQYLSAVAYGARNQAAGEGGGVGGVGVKGGFRHGAGVGRENRDYSENGLKGLSGFLYWISNLLSLFFQMTADSHLKCNFP